MVRLNDRVEFKRDFVYSTLLFGPKVLRQVVRIGKGSQGRVIFSHRHGSKPFLTVDILKAKNLEIINISRQGKFSRVRKFGKLLPHISRPDLGRMVRVLSSAKKA